MTEATKPEIVKVVRPMYRGSVRADVYDKGEIRLTKMTLPANLLHAMEYTPVAFFYATWDGKEWHIGDEAPWQEW